MTLEQRDRDERDPAGDQPLADTDAEPVFEVDREERLAAPRRRVDLRSRTSGAARFTSSRTSYRNVPAETIQSMAADLAAPSRRRKPIWSPSCAPEQMINVADAQTEPDTAAVLAAVVGIMPFRGVVMMPMLKDGQSIGGILAARLTVGALRGRRARATPDVPGSGGDRDRERAAVPGAAGAKP